MTVHDLSPSAGMTPIDYDGSKNGAVGTVISYSGGDPNDKYGVDSYAGLCAMSVWDPATGELEIVAGTIQTDKTINWGTKKNIGSISGNYCGVVVLTATKFAIVYRSNVGSQAMTIKTYNVTSGNVIGTVDATDTSILVDGSFDSISLCRISNTRFQCLYCKASPTYPSVVGITVGSGTITPDTPTVIETNAMSNTSDSVSLRYIGSNKSVAYYPKSSSGAGWRAVITDAGSSTSAGTPVQVSESTTNNCAMIAGPQGGFYMPTGSGGGGMFTASGGTIGFERVSTGNSVDYAFEGVQKPTSFNQGSADLGGAWFGDIDNDGYAWGAHAAADPDGDSVLVNFRGFKYAANPADVTVVNALRPGVSGLSGMKSRSGRVVGADSLTFLILWIDATNDDYKYMVGKL